MYRKTHIFETKRLPHYNVKNPESTGRTIACIVVTEEGSAMPGTGMTGFSAGPAPSEVRQRVPVCGLRTLCDEGDSDVCLLPLCMFKYCCYPNKLECQLVLINSTVSCSSSFLQFTGRHSFNSKTEFLKHIVRLKCTAFTAFRVISILSV